MKARLRYSKLGKIRFTSHRDTARHWERAVRKAGIPVAYSGGFSPRPRMSFGLALPTGAESLAEYLDVEFDPAWTGEHHDLPMLLNPELPVGYAVTAVAERVQGAPSLQEDVVACEWRITLDGVEGDAADEAVTRVLAAGEVLVERERKGQRSTDDVRAAIHDLSVVSTTDDPRPHLCAVLATTGRGLRPTELVGALFPSLDAVDVAARVLRTQQWIERDGALREILPERDVARAPVGCA